MYTNYLINRFHCLYERIMLYIKRKQKERQICLPCPEYIRSSMQAYNDHNVLQATADYI